MLSISEMAEQITEDIQDLRNGNTPVEVANAATRKHQLYLNTILAMAKCKTAIDRVTENNA
jgi:hypothetical protein